MVSSTLSISGFKCPDAANMATITNNLKGIKTDIVFGTSIPTGNKNAVMPRQYTVFSFEGAKTNFIACNEEFEIRKSEMVVKGEAGFADIYPKKGGQGFRVALCTVSGTYKDQFASIAKAHESEKSLCPIILCPSEVKGSDKGTFNKLIQLFEQNKYVDGKLKVTTVIGSLCKYRAWTKIGDESTASTPAKPESPKASSSTIQSPPATPASPNASPAPAPVAKVHLAVNGVLPTSQPSPTSQPVPRSPSPKLSPKASSTPATEEGSVLSQFSLSPAPSSVPSTPAQTPSSVPSTPAVASNGSPKLTPSPAPSSAAATTPSSALATPMPPSGPLSPINESPLDVDLDTSATPASAQVAASPSSVVATPAPAASATAKVDEPTKPTVDEDSSTVSTTDTAPQTAQAAPVVVAPQQTQTPTQVAAPVADKPAPTTPVTDEPKKAADATVVEPKKDGQPSVKPAKQKFSFKTLCSRIWNWFKSLFGSKKG